MSYSFSQLNNKAKEVHDWLGKELCGLRSGRAAPAVLDGILVESYGAKLPIKYVAAVSVEDARTIRIVPFDASAAKEIEKAITAANIGLSVSADDRGVRAHFPELTSERRTALVKVAKEKLEGARITMRKVRDEILKDIEAEERKAARAKTKNSALKRAGQNERGGK